MRLRVRPPDISAGWIEIVTSRPEARTISRRAYRDLAGRARRWQEYIKRFAKDSGLDVVTIGLDQAAGDIALSELSSNDGCENQSVNVNPARLL
jgi:hypothetical protein